MSDKRDRLLSASMGKLFLELALPGIIGMVAIGLYQLVDAIFVGRMVGPEALGAVSIVYPLTLINNGIAVLIGVGSASVLSRALGAEKRELIKHIFGNLVFWVLVLSAASSVVLYVFAERLVSFMGAGDGLVLEYGTSYLKIVAVGSFFVNFAQSSNMLLRGEGRMKEAMGIMAAGTVLNIILDPVLIKFAGLGINGAALATVISQVIMAVMCLIFFSAGRSVIKPGKIENSREITPDMMKVGVSAMVMQIMSLVQQTFMYKSLASYGSPDEIVVAGAAMRLIAFAFIPVWGMSQGFQPVAGVNYGAGRYDRVRESYRFFTLASTVFTAAAWVVFMIFPKQLLGWFITDAAIIESGYGMVRLMLCVFFMFGFMIMSITLFQSMGKGGNAAMLIIGRQVIFFIPLILVLPLFLGLNGVLYTMPLSDLLTIVLCAVFIIRERKFLKTNVEISGKL